MRELADYDRPPVIEVVYGVRFAPLKGWMLPHIGAFWQQVADDFPRCEHAPPIGDTDVIDPATGLPLPRVWLISDTDDRLIQLQPGRFLFNWRHRESAEPYPRYDTLSKTFFGFLLDFEKFIAKHALGDMEVLEFELTYINHILDQDGWKFPEHIGRVVDQLAWQDQRHRFLPRPLTMGWQARFPFQDASGALLVKVNPARHVRNGRQLLVVELSARGLPTEAPRDHMEDWFSHAHEWIVRGFEDLTSNEAQRELWGKHE
ncbi:MAG: TIGR04255 family protein [Geminicoccaceae bacterium]